ncbi:MAG: TonB-dependent receptor plug domain-containing protein [Bacteroidales bacterium]|nr:TonB-dependent receptor plug domain-containing protein [Bacteroidales bacterium]
MTRKIIKILILIIISISRLPAQDKGPIIDSALIMQVELREIVIKASKDNVTYKKIPASVSVISSSDITENQIRNLSDISSAAPNFFMPDYGSKLTSPVYIRGIGSRINSPSVGLYVDYVPYFEKAAFNFDFFDIQRIEILRGPQGTLFGRNTMGGIINIVTTSPMDYNGSQINLSAGNYGTYSINGGHYGRINDQIGYSLALNYLHNDGFYSNAFSGEKVDKLNSYGFRNRMIFEVTPRLTIENIAGLEISSQGGYPYAIYNDSLKAAEEINYNQYSSYDRKLFSDALILRYSGRNYEIAATSSYQYLDDLQNIDQDFTADSLYFISQYQKQHMLSQEVILRSTGNRNYNWLFGIYGFSQAFNNAVDVDAYAQKMEYLKKYDHDIIGAAFFHQSSLENFIVKNLTITAGLRIDLEKDKLKYYYDRTLRGNYAVLEDTLYPSLNSVELMPRFALNYNFNNIDFYVVAARGYKTGGFNSTFERPEDLTFNPEFSWNYEAGVKSSLFNRKLYTDVALFYIDWKNQQIYQTVPSGRGSMLKNAGHSSSMGGEVTLKTGPLRGLEFMLAYGLTNAKFISHKVNESTNYNNNYLPYVPRNTLALQATKTITLKNSRLIDIVRFNILYRGLGQIWWNEENSHRQDYYGLVDARFSFGRKSVQFDIWTKNLMNKEYASFWFEALGNKYIQTGKPAQAGVNLSLKF